MRIRQGCVERNRPIILILALLAFVGFAAADSGRISAQTPERYIVVLNEGVDLPSVASDHAVTPQFVYSHALNGFSAVVPPGRLNGLQRDPRVAYVEADQPVELFAQEVPTGVSRIFADENVNIDIDGADDWRVDVDVAVIDTGIDLDHPDLNVVASTDCTGNPFNTSCGSGGDDGNDHGTHVAGTIAALDNGIGVVGVAPGARLWAVKVLKNNGSGWMSNIIGGVDYVTEHAGEIEVANMSLGGGESQSLCDAIGNSVGAGVAYAVAAGNEDDDAANHSPANCAGVITVSALVDYDGEPGGLASSTCRNYGADDHSATFSNWGSGIEIAAPGVCILSTVPGGYATFSGTSMASPHAAGAAALLASNGADPASITSTLISEGNFDWMDDSGDGTQEPLLDVSNSSVFDPATVAGSGSAASPTTDIAVTSVDAPSSATVGDVVNVDVTVENVGNQDVTSDINVMLASDLDGDIGQQTISGGLAAGASTTLTYSWDTSGASTGDHTLTASHDFSDDDTNNDSANTVVTINAESAGGVTVTGISPSSVQAGSSVDVTITGSGFVEGATVTIENGSGPTPSASNVTVDTDQQITATITAKSGGPPRDRVWDVVVTNPDGASGVCSGCFTVTP